MQQAAQLFGVQFLAQCRRPHQVAEHHGQLAAFAQRCRRRVIVGRLGRLEWGCVLPQLGDGHQEPTPMANGGHSETLKIFGSEVAQVFSTDLVLAEGCLVAFQIQISQPTRDLHRRVLRFGDARGEYRLIEPTVSRNGRIGSARKARLQTAVSRFLPAHCGDMVPPAILRAPRPRRLVQAVRGSSCFTRARGGTFPSV